MKKRDIIKLIIFALVFSSLFIALFGKTKLNINAFTFEVSLDFSSQGSTKILFPPFGSIEAATHITPVRVNAVLENIDIDLLQEYINENIDTVDIINNLSVQFRKSLLMFTLKILILAFIGGIIGSIFVVGRDLKYASFGSITALVFVFLLLMMTYTTFDTQKFHDSKYQGALKFAPWIITLTESAFEKYNIWEEQITVLVSNLSKLSARMEQIEPINHGENDIIIMHVSDIHNNPMAHELVIQICDSFPVDFVINTGDITDFGTPIEGKLLSSLNEIQIPYLFIAGNHDSPDVMKEISKYPQVQVLSGGIIDVQGIRILSYPDPSSSSYEISPAEQDALDKTKNMIDEIWANAETKPHLVAIHNINMAEFLIGEVPLILYGHTHQVSINEKKGSVIINAGTAGGAGIRGLQSNKNVPYSVLLLYIRRNENNGLSLYAIDTISVNNLETGFIMERKTYSLPLGN